MCVEAFIYKNCHGGVKVIGKYWRGEMYSKIAKLISKGGKCLPPKWNPDVYYCLSIPCILELVNISVESMIHLSDPITIGSERWIIERWILEVSMILF